MLLQLKLRGSCVGYEIRVAPLVMILSQVRTIWWSWIDKNNKWDSWRLEINLEQRLYRSRPDIGSREIFKIGPRKRELIRAIRARCSKILYTNGVYHRVRKKENFEGNFVRAF